MNNEGTPPIDPSSMHKGSPALVESEEQQHIEGFDRVINLEPKKKVTAER